MQADGELEAAWRALSLWHDTVPGPLAPSPARAPLGGDLDVDVAIVGGGYTGLWTAYYLALADPALRVAVLEQEIAGFGASGRNGGWCSALFPVGLERLARASDRPTAAAFQRALFAAVDEVGAVAAREGVDAHWAKGGSVVLATTPTQVPRLRAWVEERRAFGFGEDDFRWLDAREAAAHVRVPACHGATWTPHCASVHPARLARGLAEAAQRRGVRVHERTRALDLAPRRVRTAAGTVTAEVVVRATEGWTPRLPGLRRALLPVYSLVIATEPLPRAFWDDVGWSARQTLGDGRHLIVYAQRSADDRIVFGGRGAPYHYGSRVEPRFDREPRVFVELQRALGELFPGARRARVTHRWGGALGAPRDWFSSVGFDPGTGLAWAGGYVGDGVAASNLAGRTLADLILRRDSELVRMPWVRHRSRRWEPEPLRWLGVNAAFRLAAGADRAEARSGRPARRRTWLLERLLGG
ncbi:MAG TPA: FAD-dependent oxidoreductase [Actinomycetes bacterium]|nr:FAD-dependent oxidoreductase [Actinomycetes bacterium]